MPSIDNFPTDNMPQDTDQVLGTSNGRTINFTLAQLNAFFGTGGGAAGNPVVSGAIVSGNLALTLMDGTVITINGPFPPELGITATTALAGNTRIITQPEIDAIVANSAKLSVTANAGAGTEDLTSIRIGTTTYDIPRGGGGTPTLAPHIVLTGTTEVARLNTTSQAVFGPTTLTVTPRVDFTATIEATPTADNNNIVFTNGSATSWTVTDQSTDTARSFVVTYLIAVTQIRDANGDPIAPADQPVTHHTQTRTYHSFFPWYAMVTPRATVVDMIADFSDAEDQRGRLNVPVNFDTGNITDDRTIWVAIADTDSHLFQLNGFAATPDQDGDITPSDNSAYRLFRFDVNTTSRLTILT